MSIRYEQRLCDNSPWCPVARACPTGAFHIDKKTFRPTLDSSRCTGCGVCVPSCPHGAVAED